MWEVTLKKKKKLSHSENNTFRNIEGTVFRVGFPMLIRVKHRSPPQGHTIPESLDLASFLPFCLKT